VEKWHATLDGQAVIARRDVIFINGRQAAKPVRQHIFRRDRFGDYAKVGRIADKLDAALETGKEDHVTPVNSNGFNRIINAGKRSVFRKIKIFGYAPEVCVRLRE